MVCGHLCMNKSVCMFCKLQNRIYKCTIFPKCTTAILARKKSCFQAFLTIQFFSGTAELEITVGHRTFSDHFLHKTHSSWSKCSNSELSVFTDYNTWLCRKRCCFPSQNWGTHKLHYWICPFKSGMQPKHGLWWCPSGDESQLWELLTHHDTCGYTVVTLCVLYL